MRATQLLIMTAALALGADAAAEPDKRKSRAALEACATAFKAGASDEAIASCTAAVAEWPGNHRAYYVLGLIQTSRDWTAASAAFDEAVRQADGDPMYQQWAGVAAYEAAHAAVRDARAKFQNRPAAEVAVDESLIDTSTARRHLERALALNDGLWRARFYLGRVHRAAGDDRQAATAFTAAIVAHADFAPAYIALVDLYRRWGYLREAAQVATAATQHVTDKRQRAEVYFALGMTHVEAQNDDAAIEALTRALEHHPGHAQALVQRGVAHYRKGDLVRARADLKAAVDGARLDPMGRRHAERLLAEIAGRRRK